jgi:hypothetical protein
VACLSFLFFVRRNPRAIGVITRAASLASRWLPVSQAVQVMTPMVRTSPGPQIDPGNSRIGASP